MSGSGSGYNRVEDVYMLKTRNLVLQNQNGTFPTKNYVFAMGDSNGHVTPTTNVSVTTVVASTSVTTAKVVASTSVTTAKVVATDVIASTILVTDISAETILVTDISAGTILVTDISAGTILVTDISAETIHVTDISAGTIHVTDISAGTIEVVGTMIISDLSLNFLNVTDISAGTIEVGTRLTATDISAGNIYVNDISATDISASLIEVCSATSHVVIQPNNIFIENFVVNEGCCMSTFSSNFGDSGLYMSQSTNPVQARIGLANIDGDFHIARGGSAPFTNIDPVIIGQSKTTLNNPVVCNGKLTVTDISAETINVTDISASSYINIGLNSSASYVPGNLYVSNDVSGSECFLQSYSTGFGDTGIYLSQTSNSVQARIGLAKIDLELHIARGTNAPFTSADPVIIGSTQTTLNNPVVFNDICGNDCVKIRSYLQSNNSYVNELSIKSLIDATSDISANTAIINFENASNQIYTIYGANNTFNGEKKGGLEDSHFQMFSHNDNTVQVLNITPQTTEIPYCSIIMEGPLIAKHLSVTDSVVANDTSGNNILAIGNAVFTATGILPVTFNSDVSSNVCSTYLEVSHGGALFYIPMLSTKPVF